MDNLGILGKNNFNTEYIVRLIKTWRELQDQKVKVDEDNLKVLVGKLPMIQSKCTKVIEFFIDQLFEEDPVMVIATWATLSNLYPFGMVVNAVSDIRKRLDWDEGVEGIQVLQNFATNGFIYRTKYKSISKVTLPEDTFEK